MGLYHSEDRAAAIRAAMERAMPRCPFSRFASWAEALAEPLSLYFEVGLPSPPKYKEWLRDRLDDGALSPYAREAGAHSTALEGFTHVDAMLVSESTGSAVLFEAKCSPTSTPRSATT